MDVPISRRLALKFNISSFHTYITDHHQPVIGYNANMTNDDRSMFLMDFHPFFCCKVCMFGFSN